MTGQWSQDELYADAASEHGAAIARVARGYEIDPEKRRDLNQEIHFQLWRSFASFDARCSLRTWVYRVAHHVAASHVLRESRKLSTLLSLEELEKLPDTEPTDIGKYVPGLQPALAGITFEQLLSHRSGLADDGRPWGKQDDAELGNAVRRWSEEVRFDESGRMVSYSNRNYAILGVAMEGILGRPYPDAMRDLLFGPLKMTRTMIRLRDAMTWTVAQGHHGRPGTAASIARPFTDNAEGWPAGFAFSTATDLARFAAEFCKAASGAEGTQLSREITSLMSTPRAKLPGLPIEFGLGLRIESMSTQYLSHGGALPGFGSQLIIVPQHGFGIVVLTNRTAGRLENSVERAMELGLPLGPKLPLKTKTPIAPSSDDLSALTGKYRHTDPQVLEVVATNGQLSLVDDGEGRPLAKIEDDLFVVGSGTDADEVAFVRTSTGAPARYLHLNGRAYRRQ